MQPIELVVFDMAGTTVTDRHEVERCFAQAALETGLMVSDERILAMQGLAKRYVGTHSHDQLEAHPHDYLLASLAELPALLATHEVSTV